MAPRQILGLTGRAQSGKDTLADVLVEERGFTRVAFADPLRDAALALNPYVHAEITEGGDLYVARLSEIVGRLGWDAAKTRFPEVRRTLQRLGTEVVRERISSDAWTLALRRRVLAIEGPVVVSDVRFPNEVDTVKDLGGTVAEVVRPDAPPVPAHASEARLDGVDFRIYNDGTLSELREYALALADA